MPAPRPVALHARPTANARLQALRAQADDGPRAVPVTVRETETLALFSAWSGVPVARIAQRSGLAPGREPKPGDHVIIEMRGEAYARFERLRRAYWTRKRAAFEARCERVGSVVHTVQPGDSLWKLRRLGSCVVPMWLLREENPDADLKSLRIGQKLHIPQYRRRARPLPPQAAAKPPQASLLPAIVAPNPPAVRRITVRPGDTLWGIARREGVSEREIIRFNGLAPPYTLRVGQTLDLPVHAGMPRDATAPPRRLQRAASRQQGASRGAPTPGDAPHAGSTLVVVQPGQTAWGIANEHGISLRALQRANPGVDLDRIRAGQRLRLPASAPPRR